jgi:multidrug efflux pump subunit AcrB
VGFALAMGAGLMMVLGVLILLFASFFQPLTILFSLGGRGVHRELDLLAERVRALHVGLERHAHRAVVALAMGAGLMMVLGVLILLFASFFQPLTILFSLPLSR